MPGFSQKKISVSVSVITYKKIIQIRCNFPSPHHIQLNSNLILLHRQCSLYLFTPSELHPRHLPLAQSHMAFASFPRLLPVLCLLLLSVSAQTVAPSNDTSNGAPQFTLTVTLNQMPMQPGILPLSNAAGLSGSSGQGQVRLPPHSSSQPS